MPRLTSTTAAIVAVATLLISGAWYSRDAARVRAVVGDVLPLRKPLGQLPLNVAGWKGVDQLLDEKVVRIAGATEYINRRCTSARGEVLNLYASYYGNPRTMVLHHPDVCYPSAGWKKQSSFAFDFTKPGEPTVRWPATVFRFEKGRDKVTVISFFNVGGGYTADREAATRATHRSIGGTDGEQRNFLAQVQVTLYGDPRTWPPDRIQRVAGGFLAGLMPELDSHLPAATGSAGPASRNPSDPTDPTDPTDRSDLSDRQEQPNG